MAYTARTLITRALYLSNVVARQFETPSGDNITDGLDLLNALLDVKGSDTHLIPYYQRYEFPLIANQEKYNIPGLYQIETVTFNIGDVRYPMTNLSRTKYFGAGRVDNISSIPFSWHAERTTGGLDLYVYYVPNEAYICKITGKFGLTDVTLDTDLTIAYDTFYIEYLRYALAEYLSQFYDIVFGEDKKRMLMTIEKKLSMVSPPDLSMKKTNFITSGSSLNWGQINIGQGWTPQ